MGNSPMSHGFVVSKYWYLPGKSKHTICLRHNTTLGHKTIFVDGGVGEDHSKNKNDEDISVVVGATEYVLHVRIAEGTGFFSGGAEYEYTLSKATEGAPLIAELGQVVREQAHALEVRITGTDLVP